MQLQQGDYDRETHYDDDPVAVARRFEASGVRWIHVVDLDAARDGGDANLGGDRGDLRERVGAGADRWRHPLGRGRAATGSRPVSPAS